MCETRICERCSKPFVWKTRTPLRRFCSRQCKDIANAALHRAKLAEPRAAHCLWCGNLFVRNTAQQIFCAEKCARAKRRSKKLPLFTRAKPYEKCQWCGDPIKLPKRKYCSERCRGDGWYHDPRNQESKRTTWARSRAKHRDRVNAQNRARRAVKRAAAAEARRARLRGLAELFKAERV